MWQSIHVSDGCDTLAENGSSKNQEFRGIRKEKLLMISQWREEMNIQKVSVLHGEIELHGETSSQNVLWRIRSEDRDKKKNITCE